MLNKCKNLYLMNKNILNLFIYFIICRSSEISSEPVADGNIRIDLKDNKAVILSNTNPVFKIYNFFKINLERWNDNNIIDLKFCDKELFDFIYLLYNDQKNEKNIDINYIKFTQLQDLVYLVDYLEPIENEKNEEYLNLFYKSLALCISNSLKDTDYILTQEIIADFASEAKLLKKLFEYSIDTESFTELHLTEYNIIAHKDASLCNLNEIYFSTYKEIDLHHYNSKIFQMVCWFGKILNLSEIIVIDELRVAHFIIFNYIDTDTNLYAHKNIDHIVYNIISDLKFKDVYILDLPTTINNLRLLFELTSVESVTIKHAEFILNENIEDNLKSATFSDMIISPVDFLRLSETKKLHKVILKNVQLKSRKYKNYIVLKDVEYITISNI